MSDKFTWSSGGRGFTSNIEGYSECIVSVSSYQRPAGVLVTRWFGFLGSIGVTAPPQRRVQRFAVTARMYPEMIDIYTRLYEASVVAFTFGHALPEFKSARETVNRLPGCFLTVGSHIVRLTNPKLDFNRIRSLIFFECCWFLLCCFLRSPSCMTANMLFLVTSWMCWNLAPSFCIQFRGH